MLKVTNCCFKFDLPTAGKIIGCIGALLQIVGIIVLLFFRNDITDTLVPQVETTNSSHHIPQILLNQHRQNSSGPVQTLLEVSEQPRKELGLVIEKIEEKEQEPSDKKSQDSSNKKSQDSSDKKSQKSSNKKTQKSSDQKSQEEEEERKEQEKKELESKKKARQAEADAVHDGLLFLMVLFVFNLGSNVLLIMGSINGKANYILPYLILDILVIVIVILEIAISPWLGVFYISLKLYLAIVVFSLYSALKFDSYNTQPTEYNQFDDSQP